MDGGEIVIKKDNAHIADLIALDLSCCELIYGLSGAR